LKGRDFSPAVNSLFSAGFSPRWNLGDLSSVFRCMNIVILRECKARVKAPYSRSTTIYSTAENVLSQQDFNASAAQHLNVLGSQFAVGDDGVGSLQRGHGNH